MNLQLNRLHLFKLKPDGKAVSQKMQWLKNNYIKISGD